MIFNDCSHISCNSPCLIGLLNGLYFFKKDFNVLNPAQCPAEFNYNPVPQHLPGSFYTAKTPVNLTR